MDSSSTDSEFLSEIKTWILNNKVDEDTVAILLIGSCADGTARETSDVDIVFIKNNQPTFVLNEKIPFEDKILDIWYHDREYMEKTINTKIEKLSDMYQISTYLSFLRSCCIWFEKEEFIKNYINIAENWKWNPEHRIFVKMIGKPPTANWAKKAFEENLEIVQYLENRFDNNLPLSHRLKEYPELHPFVEKSTVKELFDDVMFLYKEQGIEREWTEVIDAKKAMKEENWSLAFVSLKDVLYFLARRYTSPKSMQFRNPSFWAFLEDKIIPEEMKIAFEKAYLE